MAQELEIVERDPDYINPYKEESKLVSIEQDSLTYSDTNHRIHR